MSVNTRDNFSTCLNLVLWSFSYSLAVVLKALRKYCTKYLEKFVSILPVNSKLACQSILLSCKGLVYKCCSIEWYSLEHKFQFVVSISRTFVFDLIVAILGFEWPWVRMRRDLRRPYQGPYLPPLGMTRRDSWFCAFVDGIGNSQIASFIVGSSFIAHLGSHSREQAPKNTTK